MTRARFLAFISVCALALGALAISPAARAAEVGNATYAGSEDSGVITVTGASGTRYQIFAEQPDGSYALATCGMIKDAGSASVGVISMGVVGNGTPMFMVHVWTASGADEWIPLSVSVNDDHLWGWS